MVWLVRFFEERLCKAQFLEKHDSTAQYDAGLMYAEDNGWLEVAPICDMITLTDVGFAKI
jgi:hypothetical protein